MTNKLKILFALPGLHRVDRGAEVAFINVAKRLQDMGHAVTVFGSGASADGMPYEFKRIPCISREFFERFPGIPPFRGEYAYEEATFVPGLLAAYKPGRYDVTVTCGYPFVNWVLAYRKSAGTRPAHVFVTENGDWPATSDSLEYGFFRCDGLVCTNPDYFERNEARWNCALIPNGIDLDRFAGARSDRPRFGLPQQKRIVLMVSALSPTKRVSEAIDAVAAIPDCHLVVAGDGPQRSAIDRAAEALMPGRFRRMTVPPEQMPSLYRSADLFLHMSRDEAFGNVFLEALASERPVIAHDNARYRWILGEEGRFVDTGNRPLLTETIRAELDLQCSRPEARNPEARRQQVEQFSWDRIAARYEAFFYSICDARGSRPHAPPG